MQDLEASLPPSGPPMISTVLLDAGGVILDESEHEKVAAEVISNLLASVVDGYSMFAYFEDVQEAVSLFCPSVYQFVLWKYLKPDVEAFERLYACFKEQWCPRCPPLKLQAGIREEIISLADRYRLAIAGQYGKEILRLLEEHDLLRFFANQLTQDDFTITKPDPRYLEQIAAALGVPPSECVMVGDRIDKDVIPAKHLGMKTILIRTGLHRNQQSRTPWEVPNVVLDDVTELSSAVCRIDT